MTNQKKPERAFRPQGVGVDITDNAARMRDYLKLRNELGLLSGKPSLTPLGAQKISEGLDAQSALIASAACVRTSELEQLSYKAALWRWETQEINKYGGFDSDAALIAFSLYCDLIRETKLYDIVPQADTDRGFFDE
ncbi:MAG: hypothetical protein AAFQ96_03825 [Pseudomonadota bacterium]